MDKPHRVYVRLTKDQFDLARRRLFVEDLSWQTVLTALLNAYIMGDVSVTAQGRYHLAPPSGYEPVVEIEKEHNVIELEPDWGINNGRPQVGADNHRQRPRSNTKFGTRELAQRLRKETGRRITLPTLRRLLRTLDIDKGEDYRWTFTEDDERVTKILNAINDGTYDALITNGTVAAREIQEQKIDQVAEHVDAANQKEMERRAQHLKRLRSIEK